ncbi:MAG: lipoyl(octanoyl) transferase LipB [candidate division Zixibacteria bacterium]|nr:lipoyl(octanoyl) transferase LipB [candidate division Zixibacteria bacterium]
MVRRCVVAHSGCMPYEEAHEVQRTLFTARRAGLIPDILWLLEHPPTVTIGRRPGARRHLLVDEEEMTRRGIRVVETDRGGDITLHGPGQRVGYTIFDISHVQDAYRFLRNLEEVLILTLVDFGVAAKRLPGFTGVWAGEEKIAAIGVRMSYWVTMHGFSLNVAPDLGLYDGIVPCGIENRQVTSLARLTGEPPTMATVDAAIVRHTEQVFHSTTEQTTLDDLMLQTG